MTPEDRDRIMTSLATLVAGQSSTNEHLRTLNGKVVEQEKKLNGVLIWKSRVEGFNGAISLGWTSLVGLLGGGLVIFLQWLWRQHN